VEKTLWKVKQQTKYDLGRAKFVELVQDWKEEYHEKINNAIRKMGGSLDWTREAFTMVRYSPQYRALAATLTLTPPTTGRALFGSRHRCLR
jgi:valyl-tRNA synthetase